MQAEICNFKHVSVIPGIFLKININIFPFICLYSVFICEKLTFQKSFPASSPEKESVISRIQMRKRTTKKKIFFSPGTGTYPAPLRRRSSRRNKYRLLSISFFHPFPSILFLYLCFSPFLYPFIIPFFSAHPAERGEHCSLNCGWVLVECLSKL